MKTWIVKARLIYDGFVYVEADDEEDAKEKSNLGPAYWIDDGINEIVDWKIVGKPEVND